MEIGADPRESELTTSWLQVPHHDALLTNFHCRLISTDAGQRFRGLSWC